MNLSDIKNVYFVGIGGIGMSALARYFVARNVSVSGYDRTPSHLTNEMLEEGMHIHFEDDVNQLDKNAQLIIYTPAVPKDHKELNWYQENGYPVFKRSEVLEWITEKMFAITIAGTHGKTTITTLVAHILRSSGFGANAFLGGISVNYKTNYWHSDHDVAVVEADEYDRSFLKLHPNIAVITSMDPDHLDIYGTEEALDQAFADYAKKVAPDGHLWIKHGLKKGAMITAPDKRTYSLQNEGANAYAANLQIKNGGYNFDVVVNGAVISGFRLNIGGMHNVENAIVAISVAKTLEIDTNAIKDAVASFEGVWRRFQYVFRNENMIYIDDYAHHPAELAALIKSAKTLFPHKRCVIAFQPHLFTRTRDLIDGFAESLDMADEVILLEIYPAREQPIQGIDAAFLKSKMSNPNVTVLTKDGLLEYVKVAPLELFITAGAGDIDRLIEPIKEILEHK